MIPVLLIDDDSRLFELLGSYLGGNEVALSHAADGTKGLQMLDAGAFDAVLLDVMMPGMNGLEVCKRIRAKGNTPVIMLTAKGDETDRVVGLEIGADDYVTKPFSPRELVSRVKANLRRAKASTSASTEDPIRVGDLEVDPAARTVMRDGESVNLTYSEFEILLKLLKSPRRVFTREELMDHLWKGSFYGDLRSVDVHVRHLRQKIERDPANPVLIRTVRGVGYAFGREDGPAE